MFTRPVLRSEWIVAGTMPGGVVLVSESAIRVLQGPNWLKLLPLLTQGMKHDELVQELKGQVARREVDNLLYELSSEGLLTEKVDGTPHSVNAYWSLLGIDCDRNAAKAEVAVASTDKETALVLSDALSRLNVDVQPEATRKVFVTSDYLHPVLAQWNMEALRQKTPWFLVRPVGREVWIGPLLEPGATPCWACLERRLRQNGWVQGATVAAIPAAVDAAIQLAAVQIARWIYSGVNDLVTACILSLDTGNWRVARHQIARWPQCPACGTPSRNRYRKAGLTLDAHLSPITGLVGSVSVKDAGDRLFVADGELASVIQKNRFGIVSLNRRMPIGGKGTTEAKARASCIGEGIERYSLAYHGDEQVTTGTGATLRDRGHALQELLCFSQHQVQTREAWNRAHGGFHFVPEPLNPDEQIDWMRARSLMNSRSSLVPAAYCLLGYGAAYCVADTNGCAAGPDKTAATLHALLELIERDAVAIWWYNQVRRPRVRAPDIEMSFKATFARRELTLLDITSDLRIPAIAAVSADRQGRMIVVGTAAHPNAHEAASKAAAEAAQLSLDLPARPSRKTAGMTAEAQAVFRWWRSATLENQPYLRPSREVRSAEAARTPMPAGKLLEHCLRCIEKAGLDAYHVDQTRPEVGVPVSRVIVPGLRHTWARFAPGRLCDVPVQLGWRRRRLSEQELNPFLFPW